jgi:ssDNA thymidine ADP-ribosyltransferase, DarT
MSYRSALRFGGHALQMTGRAIRNLYYITHLDNVPSILLYGILSHEEIQRRELDFTAIYDTDIVSRRSQISVPDGRTLWSFANLYFQPRNPMLYRVAIEQDVDHLAVVAVKTKALARPDILLANGNAAHRSTIIFPGRERDQFLEEIADIHNLTWWNAEDGSKRRIMAECLVPRLIEPSLIDAIYVANSRVAEALQATVGRSTQVIAEPRMFFEPTTAMQVTSTLALVVGDMFFSRMQTLTVSVNTVGVMGKGLASRAKYQFPDVYVRYQDVCRRRQLRMGIPYLYKRESSFHEELADDPGSFTQGRETWFLLFATKDDWKQSANLGGIARGLTWVQENFGTEGVKSLAMPALGCGLGNLSWADIGPLMCQQLGSLGIPTWIYLPAGKALKQEWLTPDYLLG